MKRRQVVSPEDMTPLDALAVRRFQRANHPNRLALMARDLGFGSVAALVARADAIYADPTRGRQLSPPREVTDADVSDDLYLADMEG
jgi:hypothetical protein